MKSMVLGFWMLGCFAATAFAQGTKPAKAPEMTTEQRQKMADAHEKMAVCLRSDRPLSDCRDEMMKSCQMMMGSGGSCPMMGGMMGPMKQPAPQPGQAK